MSKVTEVIGKKKNGHKSPVSELGRKLRQISEKITASGEKLLTRRELERELAERRGGLR